MNFKFYVSDFLNILEVSLADLSRIHNNIIKNLNLYGSNISGNRKDFHGCIESKKLLMTNYFIFKEKNI